MRRIKNLWGLLVAIVLLSCQQENQVESEFDRSLKTWNETKAKFGNSYVYTSEMASVFGFGSRTQITVLEGQVIRRAYDGYLIDQETREEISTDSWIEELEDLDTHTEGAPILTIDEIYMRCKDEVLSVNTNDNFIFFNTENNGVLSLCTYFPKNCADDCNIGYTVNSISPLN